MVETQKQELWMRESVEFTLTDGTVKNGYRINFVRFLEEDESIDDIDEDKEFNEVVEGSIVPTQVDENFDEIDLEDIDDEDIEMFNPTFYIGGEHGKPIES